MGTVELTLPFPPSANRYWRTFRGRVVKGKDARDYKSNVAEACRGLRESLGDVIVRLDFYRPAKRGDLDNRIKILLDALQGHAYTDDKQVKEIHARLFDDKQNPRVEVRIQEREAAQ